MWIFYFTCETRISIKIFIVKENKKIEDVEAMFSAYPGVLNKELESNRPPNPRSLAMIHCAFVKKSDNYSSSIREC